MIFGIRAEEVFAWGLAAYFILPVIIGLLWPRKKDTNNWTRLPIAKPSTETAAASETTTYVQQTPAPVVIPYETYLAIDTNVLMENPYIIMQHPKLLVSKIVYRELDQLKKDTGERGRKAQEAFFALERFQQQNGELAFTSFVETEFLMQHNLDPSSPDELIIGGILKAQQQGKSVLYFSYDRGARIIARNVGLEVLDI